MYTEEERKEGRRRAKRKWDLKHRGTQEYKEWYKEYSRLHRKEQLENLRSRRKIWIGLIESLGLNKCSKCGYSKCQSALEFHHLDPELKDAKLSEWVVRKMTEERKADFLSEVSKCIRVCANCHREIHEELDNSGYVSEEKGVLPCVESGAL